MSDSLQDRTTGYFSADTLTLALRDIERLVRNAGHMRLIVGCTLDAPEVATTEPERSCARYAVIRAA